MQPDAHALLAERTAEVDAILCAQLRAQPEHSLGLLAVGGYGRRELFPHSDIDLVFLAPDEAAVAESREPLAHLLRDLWDSGLKASQSVRTVSECLKLNEQNTQLHISLLDARPIAGNLDLVNRLLAALPEFYHKNEAKLAQELALLARTRHAKFNDTVYHLEPNIKEAPGGIRDIHFLHWLSLLEPGNETIAEAKAELGESQRFLYTLRYLLHQRSRRDNNLLTFELQDRISTLWEQTPCDASQWMREYYRHARRVFHATLKVLELVELRTVPLVRQFRDWQSRLSNSEFTVSQERVLLRNPARTMATAHSLVELFTFVARHGLPLSWDTQRRLTANGKALTELFTSQTISWAEWRLFFAQGHVALALREMQKTGLLNAAIPHWRAVECLVVRDFYHRYTVDEHSIVAVEVVDQLAQRKKELPARMRELLQEEDQLATLRLALLLHDVGKGTLPGDHVQGSLLVAKAVFDRLDVPPLVRHAVTFLISHHLDLSSIMTGRDLDDPATARFLTSRIGTQEDLRRLTLLTFADISAVNPTAMTPWRLEQLWRVYSSGVEQLTRELMTDRIEPGSITELGTTADPQLTHFLHGFPTRYLRTHTPDQIRHHLEMQKKQEREGCAVEITNEGEIFVLTVLASDRSGQLAALCGALASFGMNILKAEAASNSSGNILDLFRFADPMRTLELNPSEIGRLEREVRSVIDGSAKVTDLLKRRKAPARPGDGAKISPSIRFNNDASDQCTLIDFTGEDRPGLLYDLTSAISKLGCNIDVVLVDTEAHKAMDVFYITHEGKKLDPKMQLLLGKALKQAAGAN